MFGEGTSHGTGLLWPEVKRFKLLCFVELAQVLTLSLAYNSQNSGNGFSNKFSVKEQKSLVRDDKSIQSTPSCDLKGGKIICELHLLIRG